MAPKVRAEYVLLDQAPAGLSQSFLEIHRDEEHGNRPKATIENDSSKQVGVLEAVDVEVYSCPESFPAHRDPRHHVPGRLLSYWTAGCDGRTLRHWRQPGHLVKPLLEWPAEQRLKKRATCNGRIPERKV